MVPGFFVGGAFGSSRLGIEVEHAHARQQVGLRQIGMLMSAECAIHQPMAILNIEGEAADEGLLFVGRGDEVQAILVFSVKHDAVRVGFEARMVADVNDEAMTQDSHRSIVGLFVAKGRAPGEGLGRIRARSSVWRSPHRFSLRSVMSLHLMTLFTAHPAKLINLLALLLAFPGSWLLHATRRREQRAMASIAAQRENRPDQEPTLDWSTLRMNRFFYRFGFACLGLALLVSWISTRV